MCYIITAITWPIFFVAATEYRSWLLFYSLSCMKEILSDELFDHYALLVRGIYLLCQESISQADLRKAEILLAHFVEIFDVFYGMFQSWVLHDTLKYNFAARMQNYHWSFYRRKENHWQLFLHMKMHTSLLTHICNSKSELSTSFNTGT